MAARVGGCAHAIVENSPRRLRPEIKLPRSRNHSVKGASRSAKRAPERLDPGRILTQDEN